MWAPSTSESNCLNKHCREVRKKFDINPWPIKAHTQTHRERETGIDKYSTQAHTNKNYFNLEENSSEYVFCSSSEFKFLFFSEVRLLVNWKVCSFYSNPSFFHGKNKKNHCSSVQPFTIDKLLQLIFLELFGHRYCYGKIILIISLE